MYLITKEFLIAPNKMFQLYQLSEFHLLNESPFISSATMLKSLLS